jgi:hypothetical protein
VERRLWPNEEGDVVTVGVANASNSWKSQPMQTLAQRCAAPLLMSALAVAAPACFLLERSSELEDGVVGGRAVRVIGDERSPAAFSRAQLVGAPTPRTADRDGAFRIPGVPGGRFDLRITDDVDGDGWINRAQIVSGRMPSREDGRQRASAA